MTNGITLHRVTPAVTYPSRATDDLIRWQLNDLPLYITRDRVGVWRLRCTTGNYKWFDRNGLNNITFESRAAALRTVIAVMAADPHEQDYERPAPPSWKSIGRGRYRWRGVLANDDDTPLDYYHVEVVRDEEAQEWVLHWYEDGELDRTLRRSETLRGISRLLADRRLSF